MTANNNSATRLHRLLKALGEQPDKRRVSDAWAMVLGINEVDDDKRSYETVEALGRLHRQVDTARRLMRSTEISQELYESALNRCKRAMSVDTLSAKMSDIRQNLAPDVLIAIAWCGETLAQDEQELEPEVLAELQSEVEALRAAIEREDLPASLREFVSEQIQIIEKALREFPIVGARALSEALFQGYSHTQESGDAMNEAPHAPEINTLGSIWGRIRDLPGALQKADKTLGAVQGIADKGLKALEWFGGGPGA